MGFTPPLTPAWTGSWSLTVGPLGPLVKFDQSPPASFLLWPNRGGAPAIDAGDWRLLAGSRGQGWIHQHRPVLPGVVGSAWVEGVAGGELRGGGGFGGFRGSGYGGSWPCLRGWAAPHDRGEEDGGAGWMREGLFATNGTGVRRRPN